MKQGQAFIGLNTLCPVMMAFGKRIADQGKQIEELNSTIQSKDEEIAHLKELLEKKEKEAKKTGYQYRVVTKKQNKGGTRNKKKKK